MYSRVSPQRGRIYYESPTRNSSFLNDLSKRRGDGLATSRAINVHYTLWTFRGWTKSAFFRRREAITVSFRWLFDNSTWPDCFACDAVLRQTFYSLAIARFLDDPYFGANGGILRNSWFSLNFSKLRILEVGDYGWTLGNLGSPGFGDVGIWKFRSLGLKHISRFENLEVWAFENFGIWGFRNLRL